ncbi:MAG: hypothetical protein R2747_01840 [Pyrinomonadaceae bacterium]
MSENGTVTATEETNAETNQNTEGTTSNTDEISYHAVEKEGAVTAIWEMQGPIHLRTIDPRSSEGKKILSLFETAA